MMSTDEQIREELSKVFDNMSVIEIHSARRFTRYPQLISVVAKNLSEDRHRVYMVLFMDENFEILPGREDMVVRRYDKNK